MDFIGTIEAALGQTAKKNFLPMQDGDVQATYADVDNLIRDTGFKPATRLGNGWSGIGGINPNVRNNFMGPFLHASLYA